MIDPFNDKVTFPMDAERLREVLYDLENSIYDIEHLFYVYRWLGTFETKSRRVDGGWEGVVRQIEKASGVRLEMPRAIRILKNLERTSGGRVCIDAYEDGLVMFYYKDLNRKDR